MATITDSLFSLIIFIYVMVTFLYLFYGFCWIDAPKKTQADLEEENKLVRLFSRFSIGLFFKRSKEVEHFALLWRSNWCVFSQILNWVFF